MSGWGPQPGSGGSYNPPGNTPLPDSSSVVFSVTEDSVGLLFIPKKLKDPDSLVPKFDSSAN